MSRRSSPDSSGAASSAAISPPARSPRRCSPRISSYVIDFAPAFAGVLQALAEPGHVPALIHCNGGKDRTGFAATIVLLRTRRPRATIVEDYLLTNHFTRWTTRRRIWLVFLASRLSIRPREMRALLEAREPYLDAAFAAMDERLWVDRGVHCVMPSA